MIRTLLAALPALLAILLAAGCSDGEKDPAGPGAPAEVLGPFRAAAACGDCHPQHYREWERSMHAFAGSDPVMLALSELARSEAGNAVADECIQCHSPALVRQEQWLASLPAGSNPTLEDLTHDGISCDFCHSVQIIPPVGDIRWFDTVDPSAPKLGSIADPVENEFHESRIDASFRTSIQCAACHQVDLDDGTGVENTYLEWERSILSGQGIECQDCHMPAYDGPAASAGPVRRVHRHEFVGVDYLTADFRGADRAVQLAAVRGLLENSVLVEPDIPAQVSAGGTLDLGVAVSNELTGHSIPSGTSFSRDMWIEITVSDGTGALLYRSGWLEANGDLVDPTVDLALVRFGSVMTDENGDPTLFTWRAVAIDETELLRYGATRQASYAIDVPAGTPGPLTVVARLRFRPLKPEILRAASLPELLPIEIFDMWSTSASVVVTP